ncbi:rRNA-processing protein efg1 [Phlyctema vagabunda]|uniref:rRNA-processing protein EFG1 n=1 Tax=Phlyctema vagabunda TaxID=108571 RepID=A0ABR4PRI7_9HELO
MSSKRKQPDSENEEVVHSSRQQQVFGNPKPAKKLRKSEPAAFKKQAHASSVNAIKKRIRDVTRRLERSEDLPANVRIEDERALAAYQQDLAAADAEKIRQKMIKKYHMVRFFERQKATRQLKKLRKRLLETESTDEVDALKKEMHIAEVDLNYTQFSPLSETYISLYPPKTGDEEVEGLTRPKPAMWLEVEKCMEDGTLNRLRNRVATVPTAVSKPKDQKTAKVKLQPKPKPQPKPEIEPLPMDTTGLNRRQRRAQRNQGGSGLEKNRTKNKSMAFARNQAFGAELGAKRDEADGDSDGGFFEE